MSEASPRSPDSSQSPIQSSRAYVLRRSRSGEADVIARVLLEDGRSLSLKIHGILASRRRSNLIAEPGCLISAVYYRSKDDQAPAHLKEATVLNRREDLKADYEGMLMLAYALELTERAGRATETSELFTLLEGALNTLPELDRGQALSARVFFAFYKVRLLKLIGILGDPGYCTRCGENMTPEARWQMPQVEFYCSRCATEATEREGRMAGLISRAASRRFARFQEQWAEQNDPPEILFDTDENLGRCLDYFFAAPSAAGPALYQHLRREP